jgi:hypothetical protein
MTHPGILRSSPHRHGASIVYASIVYAIIYASIVYACIVTEQILGAGGPGEAGLDSRQRGCGAVHIFEGCYVKKSLPNAIECMNLWGCNATGAPVKQGKVAAILASLTGPAADEERRRPPGANTPALLPAIRLLHLARRRDTRQLPRYKFLV